MMCKHISDNGFKGIRKLPQCFLGSTPAPCMTSSQMTEVVHEIRANAALPVGILTVRSFVLERIIVPYTLYG